MGSLRTLERARALIGTPFRPQGRCGKGGVDCVGLVIEVFRLNAAAFPDDYRPSGRGRKQELLATVERFFRQVSAGEPGRLAVIEVGRGRLHLAIAAPGGVVHADARRGAVVEGPIPAGATVLGFYRKRRTPLSKGID